VSPTHLQVHSRTQIDPVDALVGSGHGSPLHGSRPACMPFQNQDQSPLRMILTMRLGPSSSRCERTAMARRTRVGLSEATDLAQLIIERAIRAPSGGNAAETTPAAAPSTGKLRFRCCWRELNGSLVENATVSVELPHIELVYVIPSGRDQQPFALRTKFANAISLRAADYLHQGCIASSLSRDNEDARELPCRAGAANRRPGRSAGASPETP